MSALVAPVQMTFVPRNALRFVAKGKTQINVSLTGTLLKCGSVNEKCSVALFLATVTDGSGLKKAPE